MTQPTLPGLASVHDTRDPLGRRYTPDPLAAAVVARLVAAGVVGHLPCTVVEPHVGGGGFVRAVRSAAPSARVVGVDLDPRAEGLASCGEQVVGDWLDVAGAVVARSRPRLIVGNPPFDDPKGGSPTRAQDHLAATFEAVAASGSDGLPVTYLAWVLPLAYLGTQAWGRLLTRWPTVEVTPIVGRPWEQQREVALYRWLVPFAGRPGGKRVDPHLGRIGQPIDGWK